jgi:hypothetical protein
MRKLSAFDPVKQIPIGLLGDIIDADESDTPLTRFRPSPKTRICGSRRIEKQLRRKQWLHAIAVGFARLRRGWHPVRYATYFKANSRQNRTVEQPSR